MPDEPVTVRSPCLRHPDLVFHVDVTLTEHEGRWLAIAMLADEPDIGTGTDPGRRNGPRWPPWASRTPMTRRGMSRAPMNGSAEPRSRRRWGTEEETHRTSQGQVSR